MTFKIVTRAGEDSLPAMLLGVGVGHICGLLWCMEPWWWVDGSTQAPISTILGGTVAGNRDH